MMTIKLSKNLDKLEVALKISKRNQILQCPKNWTMKIEKWGI